jgi:hypothetical protein
MPDRLAARNERREKLAGCGVEDPCWERWRWVGIE